MKTLEKPAKAASRHSAARVKAPTLADVAARAEVSAVAVSVVLSNTRSRVRVSPATRERILKAAEDLDYRPNAVARSLRLQRTNIIGFYNSHRYNMDPRYPFYGALIAGLLAGCEDHNKDFLKHGTFRDRDDDDVFQELLNGQIDGLVVYARGLNALVDRLVESRLPVVSIVNEVPGLPSVVVDNVLGGKLMAQHLAKRGYTCVLYRRPEEEAVSTLKPRFESFYAEATALGLKVLQSRNSGCDPTEEEKEMLLSSPETRPQALVAWNDWSADGVVAFCEEQGMRVPQDLAVMGFDGLTSQRRPASQLTTIRAPWFEVAQTATSLLVARCAGEDVPERTMLPVELLVGDTT